MKRLKTLLTMISVICLSGCNTIEVTRPQCSPVFTYENIEGENFINPRTSFCFCREYKFSKGFIGPVSKPWQEPFESCNKIIGWKPSDYVDVYEFWEYVRKEVERETN